MKNFWKIQQIQIFTSGFLLLLFLQQGIFPTISFTAGDFALLTFFTAVDLRSKKIYSRWKPCNCRGNKTTEANIFLFFVSEQTNKNIIQIISTFFSVTSVCWVLSVKLLCDMRCMWIFSYFFTSKKNHNVKIIGVFGYFCWNINVRD